MSDVRLYPLNKISALSKDSDKAILVVTEGTGSESDAAEISAAIGSSVTAASIDTALETATPEQESAIRGHLGITLSSSGGAGNVPQFDGNGNLITGTLRTQSYSAAGNDLNGLAGNILLPDDKFIGWGASDANGTGVYGFSHLGRLYAAIRYDRSHSGGGEWNFDASSRVCWYWSGGYQMGNAEGGSHFVYYHCGSASAGNPMRQSVPIHFLTKTWTGGTNVDNPISMQAAPLDTSGTNTALRFFRGATMDGQGQEITSGTMIAEMANDGIWTPGVAPAFVPLTADGATITQACSRYRAVQSASVTLAGNWTLVILGLIAGMRGVIYVQQDATGSRTLTPSGGAALDLSTAANTRDRVAWEFDGLFLNFSVTKNVQREIAVLDSDAAAFITAAAITDNIQKIAINTMVGSLKSASLWAKFYSIYPFVGGNPSAHLRDLKAFSNITWAGGLTHDANGVTGNGTSGVGTTGVNFNALGARDNCSAYVYCRTATPTEGGHFFGAIESPNRFGIRRTGSFVTGHGPHNSEQSIVVSTGGDCRKHFVLQRSASNFATVYVNGAFSNNSTAAVAAPNLNQQILAWNSPGGAGAFSNANLGLAAFGQALSESEWATFRGIVDEFQTTLGRANP